MSDEDHQIAGAIEAIRVQLEYLSADVKSVHKSVDKLRGEVRHELTTLRAATAVVVSRQNSEIDSVKKKSLEFQTGSWVFTTD